MTRINLDSFEAIAAVVVVIDVNGLIVACNRACSDCTGYSLEDVRGHHVWEFLPIPAQAEAAKAAYARLRDSGIRGRCENCWVTKTGQRRWLSWSNSVVRGDDGEIEYVLASAVDITAHRGLEEALRRSRDGARRAEAHMRAVFEHTFQFIGLLAPDGTLLDANRSALEFVGARREDVVGRPFWATPWWREHPSNQEQLKSAIREAAQGRFARFEATHRDKDGRTAVIDFSLTPVAGEDGRVVLLVPEGRDITERKRREARQQFLAEAGGILATGLRYREMLSELAKLAVRSLADCCMFHLLDEYGEGRRLQITHAAADRPWFADFLEQVPADCERPDFVWAALATKQPVLISAVAPGEIDACAQGEEHLRALRALEARSMMAVPLVARGRVLGSFLFVSSRLDLQYGPEDLLVAVELAQRAALTIENARLYRAACEAIASRDELLTAVAHDLRSPLNAAALATEAILAVRPEMERPECARRAAETTRRSLERANRLIGDLLDVASIEAGKLAVEPAPVSPRDLVVEAADALALIASEASIEVQTHVEDGLPPVLADRARILQVFSNLIGNALKFTPPGGRVRVAAEGRGREVCFGVSDTGCGIPAEHLARVFDRFWQGRGTDRRGIGHGLCIARGIVHAHLGRIWIESAPGQGTSVFFTLPVAPVPGTRPGAEVALS